jgi:hypothetical protein
MQGRNTTAASPSPPGSWRRRLDDASRKPVWKPNGGAREPVVLYTGPLRTATFTRTPTASKTAAGKSPSSEPLSRTSSGAALLHRSDARHVTSPPDIKFLDRRTPSSVFSRSGSSRSSAAQSPLVAGLDPTGRVNEVIMRLDAVISLREAWAKELFAHEVQEEARRRRWLAVERSERDTVYVASMDSVARAARTQRLREAEEARRLRSRPASPRGSPRREVNTPSPVDGPLRVKVPPLQLERKDTWRSQATAEVHALEVQAVVAAEEAARATRAAAEAARRDAVERMEVGVREEMLRARRRSKVLRAHEPAAMPQSPPVAVAAAVSVAGRVPKPSRTSGNGGDADASRSIAPIAVESESADGARAGIAFARDDGSFSHLSVVSSESDDELESSEARATSGEASCSSNQRRLVARHASRSPPRVEAPEAAAFATSPREIESSGHADAHTPQPQTQRQRFVPATDGIACDHKTSESKYAAECAADAAPATADDAAGPRRR